MARQGGDVIHREIPIGDALLRTYVLSNYDEIDPGRRRAFIVICPGGAYRFCSDREAECVAVRFNALGYNCAVLFYSTNHEERNEGNVYSTLFPKPQEELAQAVSYVRENCDELNTDPDKVVVMGFSAGGHLAASLGVLWRRFGKASRPNAMVLCYPVITSGPLAHVESIRRLIGTDDGLLDTVSLERNVCGDTPPAFIWTTRSDAAVPYENSVMFADALRQNNVQCSLKVYENGPHGLSLGTCEVFNPLHVVETLRSVKVFDWPELADTFLVEVLGSRF